MQSEKRTNQRNHQQGHLKVIAALNEGHSETLTRYLRAIGRFIDLFPTRSR